MELKIRWIVAATMPSLLLFHLQIFAQADKPPFVSAVPKFTFPGLIF
jgi:hypothetical protein